MLQFLFFFLSIQNSCKETEGIHFYLTEVPWEYFKGENVSIQLILPIFAFLAICFFLWEFLLGNRKIRLILSDKLKYIAFGILLAGFILYFIGYSHQIKGIDPWMIFGSTIQAGFRALMSSLGMFVFDTDFIEISEAYHHNIWYLIAFSLVHLLGILVTTHVVLRLLGERFLSSRRMSRILNKSNKRDIYIFWGINEESITLARSINNKYHEDKNEKGLELIFVETPSEKELEIKEHSISHFFNSSLHGSSEKDRIEDMEGTFLYPKRRLIDAEKELQKNDNNELQKKEEKRNQSNNGKEIFEKLGLSKLYKLICNELQKDKEKDKEEVVVEEESNLSNNGKEVSKESGISFFFLSDDEQKNIQDTLIIQEIIQEIFSGKITNDKLHLYCKSRDNYANRAIIDEKSLFVTKIIDDATLSINVLKEMQNNMIPSHPINYVETDPMKGTVKAPFTSLIIGFGTTGQDALRFIYEYGVFVKSPGELSPFKCYVIDKEMKNIQGQFIREVPALDSDYIKRAKTTNQIKWSDKQLESMGESIIFLNYDWNSSGLKKRLTNDVLNELNYVVIATGNDKSNMTITAELYEYVKRNRKKGLDKFHIFVRVYNKENEKLMEAISEFYKKNEHEDIITVFGKQSDIYTYKNIIKDDEKENKAKEFFELYQKASNGNETWKDSDKADTYADRLEKRHKKGQNFSNVLHMYTKLQLCRNYISRELPNWEAFPFKLEGIEDENEKHFLECLNNLSELEHIRWNASHYMAGFIYDEKKDFMIKTHKCLKPFNELDKDGSIKRYDYATVITTIELNKRKPIVEFHS